MHLRSIARLVFLLAVAVSLSAPLAGSAAACPPGTDPGLC